MLLVAAASVRAQSVGDLETGLAAVYADALSGHLTASGEIYDRARLTAAHRTLPFGTMVRVTSSASQRRVDVRITDRGPTQANRVVDLSRAAAARLGFGGRGLHEVTIEVLSVGPGTRKPRRAP